MNTMNAAAHDLITRTKSGAKIHRTPPGSVNSLCGQRTPVRIRLEMLTASTIPHLCGHCYGAGLEIGLAFARFVYQAARIA